LKRIEILRVLAGQHAKTGGTKLEQIGRLRAVSAAVLEACDIRMPGKLKQGLVGEIDRGPIGDVVEHDRPRRVVGESGEMPKQAALRGPQVVWTRDQIAIDRPSCGLVKGLLHLAGRGAGQSEADRQVTAASSQLGVDQCNKPLEFGPRKRKPLARSRRQNQSIDWAVGVVTHERPQRGLVELAIAEGRDEREPQSLQSASKIVHCSISMLSAGERANKNPASNGGAFWSDFRHA